MKILLALYAVLAGVGGFWIYWRSRGDRPMYYVAIRTLPANHHLIAADIRPPSDMAPTRAVELPDKSDLVGRYNSAEIPALKEVKPEGLVARPLIQLAQDKSAVDFFLPAAQAGLSQIIDPGFEVDLCSPDKCLGFNAPVLAVECGALQSSSCWLDLQLSVPEARQFAAFTEKQKLQAVVVHTGGH